MPRRKVIAKREILPEVKFGSELLAKFINTLMLSGKKSIAEKVIYSALEEAVQRLGSKIKEKQQAGREDGEGGESSVGGESSSAKPLEVVVFEHALKNVKPAVEVRSRRIGGATYQVPVEVRSDRSQALGMRWIVQCARARGEKGMIKQLAAEIIDAFNEKGAAVKKRDDTHRMAKANQAFAHFHWN